MLLTVVDGCGGCHGWGTFDGCVNVFVGCSSCGSYSRCASSCSFPKAVAVFVPAVVMVVALVVIVVWYAWFGCFLDVFVIYSGCGSQVAQVV